MATLGCTLRATRRDAQVRRVSWDPDVADASLGTAQGKVPGEVPRLVGSAEGRGEHEPGVVPDVTGPDTVGGLALGTMGTV
jgi:hypothetical protein